MPLPINLQGFKYFFSVAMQTYMKPSEIRQYLYQLKLKPKYSLQVFSDGAGAIGKLDIVWKSSFGERGRLQTSQLQRAVS